jgi:DNA polymerase-3 subunit alpha
MYLIFDTETTGLPRDYNAPVTDTDNWPRMVQIAWQLHDAVGALVEVKNYIVKPEGYTIPFNAEKVHGISTERAEKEGMPLEWVLNDLLRVLQQTQFTAGHNIEFDLKVVGAEFVRKQIEGPLLTLPSLDTKDLSTDYCAIPGGKGGKFKWPTLTELHQKLFQSGFGEAHNAAADVEATARCFLELIRLQVIPHALAGLDAAAIKAFKAANPDPIEAIGLHIQPYSPLEAESGKEAAEAIVTTANNDQLLYKGSFIHLHCHTQYSSTLPGTTSVESLVRLAKEQGMEAVAMTDHGNLYGAFAFVNEATKAGIKPIIGCDFFLCRDHQDKKQKDNGFNQLLLAKNKNGYQNLIKLSSISFIDGFYYVPRIDKKLLAQYKGDLIATTGGMQGEIPYLLLNVGEHQAEEAFCWWHEQFGEDFYIELQRHGLPEEDHVNRTLLAWAKKYGVKYFAANHSYYDKQADAESHDILLCVFDGEHKETPIGKGRGYRFGLPNDAFYFKSTEEMAELFNDLPEALSTTLEIANKIEAYQLKRDVLLPRFDIPEAFADEDDYLRHLTYEGAKKRWGEISDEIRERLDFELATIKNTGYPGYFLIVQDFTNSARKMGVSVGPGRGSAAGSAVAYCIGITNVDPIAYDLLFERFLNPDRISMPDIDIDFDDRGREKVMRYVIDKYGQNQVAQIVTYGTMAAKSSIRNTARALNLPLNEADILAKAFPDGVMRISDKAFRKQPLRTLVMQPEKLEQYKKELQSDEYQQAKQFLDFVKNGGPRAEVLKQAAMLEGAIRNTGTHACGVIITPEDVTNLVPVKTTESAEIKLVTQFDNDVAESAGLLKMDFLGLSTLTIINDAIDIIEKRHGIRIDPDKIPLDDSLTYELFQRGETVGIFQYESPGMQKYMKELKPDSFADLIAMNALYRPGPLAYIPNFISRKHGREPITYDLDDMREYLEETYGITVYQEQVMLLSQKLAGFSKGEADTLRKAMGKKQKDVLDKMKKRFMDGAIEKGHAADKLEKVWTDWEAFAEYAFNKSHSTCYAVVAFQTAYLKANYPAEYMAAVLSNNLNDISKVSFFMEECRRMGMMVLGPDINESSYRFTVNQKGEIRFGLGGVKGVGEGAVEAIVQEREQNGPYKSIYDVCKRIDLRQANKKTLESLGYAGAFDSFEGVEGNRRVYFQEIDGTTVLEKAIRYGNQYQQLKNQAQASLFGEAGIVNLEEPQVPGCEPWSLMDKLQREKEVVGMFITAHPLDAFRIDIQNFCNAKLSQLDEPQNKGKTFNVAGLVTDVQYQRDSKDQEVLAFTVEDYESSKRFRMRGEQAMASKHLVVVGTSLLMNVTSKSFVGKDGKEVEYLALNSVELMSEVRSRRFRELLITLSIDTITPGFIDDMDELFEAHPGSIKVRIKLVDHREKLVVELSTRKNGISPDNSFINGLKKLPIVDLKLN